MTGPVVAIHQPNLMPWIGWFDKVAAVDQFVLLDDVQLERKSHTTRARFSGPAGPWTLSVPVVHDRFVRIDAALIDWREGWGEKAFRRVEAAYRRAPGWREFVADAADDVLEKALTSPEPRLAAFNARLFEWMLRSFGIRTPTTPASSIPGGPRAPGNPGVVEICRRLGASVYVSGAGSTARGFNDPAAFAAIGCELREQEFVHPVYRQPGGGEFVPGVSALDFLLCAPDEARAFFARRA